MRVVIADDERPARQRILDLLAEYPAFSCVAESASGAATVAAVNRCAPDLLFLDIEMPGSLGTDVLTMMAVQPHVVFTTAHPEYALTAWELGVVDYLVKPITQQRFGQAIERVQRVATDSRSPGPVSQGAFLTRLFIRRGGAIIPLAVEEVAYIQARRDYVDVHTTTTRYVVQMTMKSLAQRLDPARFVRVHRSFIVNLDRVDRYERLGSRLEVCLDDGRTVPTSRRHAREIRGRGR